MKGSYCIAAFLTKDSEMEIGKLGIRRFPRGLYVYTGSALSSIENRLRRHLRKDKRKRWHIDYFLDAADIIGFVAFLSPKKEECSINSMFLERGEVIANGLGSSDCRCPSHLVFLGD
ncbi:MAG: DUF123 domain-containing protein [Thermoplasmata archaeon]